MQCPHYCYQGNQAPPHNHPTLSFFLEREKKKGRGLGWKERSGNDKRRKKMSDDASFWPAPFSSLWLFLFHHLICLSCFGREIMLTSVFSVNFPIYSLLNIFVNALDVAIIHLTTHTYSSQVKNIYELAFCATLSSCVKAIFHFLFMLPYSLQFCKCCSRNDDTESSRMNVSDVNYLIECSRSYIHAN